jgi:hypothetical protein
MRTIKEIQADIRQHKAWMKDSGIRRTSFMNGGLDTRTYQANARLFALETELHKAKQAA